MLLLQAVATVLVLTGIGAVAGIPFDEVGLGAFVGLVTALILALPVLLLGTGRDKALSLRGFFLFFRSGQGG